MTTGYVTEYHEVQPSTEVIHHDDIKIKEPWLKSLYLGTKEMQHKEKQSENDYAF